jgi:hypothetical protein
MLAYLSPLSSTPSGSMPPEKSALTTLLKVVSDSPQTVSNLA